MAFPIEIDATGLIATRFMIPGVTPTWQPTREETPSKRMWQMEPGTYQFVLPSSSIPAVEFEVRMDGTVFYADAVAGFLDGRGHSALIVVGYPITLDAKPLAGATIYFGLINVSGWLRTSESPQTVRLLPGTYQLGLYTGAIAGALFEVTLAGTIQYDDALEVTRQPGDPRPPGYLTGKGTRTLRLDGYAITLDALSLQEASPAQACLGR